MNEAVWETAPRCEFSVRTQVTDDPPTYRYDVVQVRGGEFGQTGYLTTPHPPAVGDLVHLVDEVGPHTGTYRVFERAWRYASYGSADWRGGSRPTAGPLLDIVVVPCEGLCRDEAGDDDD